MDRTIARRLALDVVLACGFGVVAMVELAHEASNGLYYAGGPVTSGAIAVLTVAALAVRRLWPVPVFVAVFALHVGANLAVPHALAFFGTMWPLMILAYSGPRLTPRRWTDWTLAGPLAFVATFWVHTPEARQVDDFAGLGVMLVAPWVAGRVIAQLREQRGALDAALGEIGSLEEERRRQVLLAERARIAREMHDVVAHGVSVMVVQAGSARFDLDEDPAAARTSLLAIERAGRDVLAELRRTVSLLRGSDESAPPGDPAPGLAELYGLVSSMQRAGLRIDLEVADGLELDPGRGLTVYRVVQEALTNVLRHVGPTAVRVRVAGTPDLVVEVHDEGRNGSGASLAAGPGGHGLVGMEERVAMYGGRFTASSERGGFTVRAEIPAEGRP